MFWISCLSYSRFWLTSASSTSVLESSIITYEPPSLNKGEDICDDNLLHSFIFDPVIDELFEISRRELGLLLDLELRDVLLFNLFIVGDFPRDSFGGGGEVVFYLPKRSLAICFLFFFFLSSSRSLYFINSGLLHSKFFTNSLQRSVANHNLMKKAFSNGIISPFFGIHLISSYYASEESLSTLFPWKLASSIFFFRFKITLRIANPNSTIILWETSNLIFLNYAPTSGAGFLPNSSNWSIKRSCANLFTLIFFRLSC